jgi:hypothetical protein
MRASWIACLLLVCSQALAAAADGPKPTGASSKRAAGSSSDADRPKPTGVPFRRSAGSSIDVVPFTGGHFVVRKINQTFDFIDPFDGQDGLLLSEEVMTKGARPLGEGFEVARVRVTAFDVSPTGKQQKRHEFVVTGQEGQRLDRFRYRVTAFGYCDSWNGYVVYSIWTGKPILYTSGWNSADALAHLEGQPASGPGADTERWIGVYTNNAPYDDVVFGERVRGTRALVTYARTEAPLARVLVDLGPAVTEAELVKELQIKPGPLIHIKLTDGGEIELPIKGDQLDIARAKLPGDATAKRLPVEWPPRPKK